MSFSSLNSLQTSFRSLNPLINLGTTIAALDAVSNPYGYFSGTSSNWTGGVGISSTGKYAIVSNYDSSVAANTGTGKLYYTSNFGVTWTQSTGIPATGVYLRGQSNMMSRSGQTCAIFNMGNSTNCPFYYSTNYGQTFTSGSVLPTTYYMQALSVSDTVILTGSAAGGVQNAWYYITAPFTGAWTALTGTNVIRNISSITSSNTVYVSSTAAIYRSTTAGQGASYAAAWATFTATGLATLPATANLWGCCDVSQDGIVVLIGQTGANNSFTGGGLYLSINSGSTFNLVGSPLPNVAQYDCCSVSADGKYMAVGIGGGGTRGGGVYISTNGGLTWRQITSGTLTSTSKVGDIKITPNVLIVQVTNAFSSTGRMYISFK